MPKKSFNPNLIAGNKTTSQVRKPGAAEDGKVIGWDDTSKVYDMINGGGGSVDHSKGYYDLSLGVFPDPNATQGDYWIADPALPAGNLQGVEGAPGVNVPPGARIEAGITNPGNVQENWIVNQ